MPSRVVLVTGDLMAGSQAEGAANAAGVELHTIGPAKLDSATGAASPSLVVFDLSMGVGDLAAKIRSVRQRWPGAAVAAYGPHVQQQRLDAAREAGCDAVLSRGQFYRHAAELFTRYAGDADADATGSAAAPSS